MRTLQRGLLLVGMLILMVVSPGQAQENQDLNVDLLREKVEQFEESDIATKAPFAQDIHKRTLLRLYKQYGQALKQKITELKNNPPASSEAGSERQSEIASQIRKLEAEQNIIVEKSQTLGGDMQAEAHTVSPDSNPTISTTDPPTTDSSSARSDQSLTTAGSRDGATGRDVAPSTNPTPDSRSKLNSSVQEGGGTTEFKPKIWGRVYSVTEESSTEKRKGNNPVRLKNMIVRLRDKDGTLKAITTTMDDKSYTFNEEIEPREKYTISVEGDDEVTKREFLLSEDQTELQLDIPIEDRPVSLLSRAVIGYEQSGASSATKSQKYFFDLYLSKPLPIPQKIDPDFGERLRAWGNIRFTSVPQSGDVGIGTFATTFVANAAAIEVRKAAQVIDFSAGLEYRLFGNSGLLPSFDRQTKQKFSLSFIAGFGAITPTSPREAIQVFEVFKDAPGLPPGLENKKFVAFVPLDRDRFFRQYFGGLRLQTFFFTPFNAPKQRFPAMLDVTYGQNEFATGGRFRGGVFRLDGFFPLPYDSLKFINLFGSAVLKPSRTKTTAPLILRPVNPGTVPVPADNVGIVNVPQENRDYYRVGVGIDFISFIQTLRKKTNK